MSVQLKCELITTPAEGVGQQATAKVAVGPPGIRRPAATQQEVGTHALVGDQRVNDRRLQRIEAPGHNYAASRQRLRAAARARLRVSPA